MIIAAKILSNQAGKGSQAFAWNLLRETVSGTFGNRSSKRQDQISVLLNGSSEEEILGDEEVSFVRCL